MRIVADSRRGWHPIQSRSSPPRLPRSGGGHDLHGHDKQRSPLPSTRDARARRPPRALRHRGRTPAGPHPEVRHRLVQFVKAGCSGEVAARAAGISTTTWYEVKRKGHEETSGPHRELLEELEQAQAHAVTQAMAFWRRDMADPGNWRACVAYIDRFDRGRFQDEASQAPSERSPSGTETPRPTERRLKASDLSDAQIAGLERAYANSESGNDEESEDR
jgi:hypothetical protein